MGPLVPEIIGNELNLVVALFIGIAFGFILEQAGFSTSKKLVGLFYGYDFTVLRVFFTAGLVAMTGVIVFDHYGILDISLVYINPTFLWSAIVGGIIMGLGFVIGGFCPGTSVCAAAIGKIDAMIFVLGSFIGVYIFAEAYPLLEGLYKAANMGNIRIFDSLGMAQGVFAFLLIVVALSAFWMVKWVESRVNKLASPFADTPGLYYGLTAGAVVIAFVLIFLPPRKQALLQAVENPELTGSTIQTMDSDELAFRLIENNKDLQIIDLRPAKSTDTLILPQSHKFTPESLLEKEAYKLLSVRHRTTVFIADNETEALKGALVAEKLGYRNLFYLKGGLASFKADIINFKNNKPAGEKLNDTERFRTMAASVLPALVHEYKLKQTAAPKKSAKRVLGGC